MSVWTRDKLRKIADTDDLHIPPYREDGTTYGTPTWIWSVVVDPSLYVRAYNGNASSWYKATVRNNRGRITAAGMTKDVTFEPVDESMNDRIDDASRTKYKTSPYLPPMISQRSRSTTVKIELSNL